MPFTLRSRRVVLPDAVRPASIHINDETIARVADYTDAAVELLDMGDSVIMPGLVDTHVHVNDPGRTRWEGFETATRAAAAGGITTLIDMPLNSLPATTTVAGLEEKRDAAQGNSYVDVGFWGGVVPGNEGEIRPLIDSGVLGFKCFLVHSGVDEFPNVSEADLRKALPHLRDSVLLVHAESPEHIRTADSGDPHCYETYLRSRPAEAEHSAIEMMIRLGREFGVKIHIVHVSSAGSIPLLRESGIGAETCPHYLTFAAEEIVNAATEFKCAPPIRGRENRERLWDGLREGAIRMVASDHSPCPPELKRGNFFEAWGGISSLQLCLPVMWTEASRRSFGLLDLTRWMSSEPAKLAGLDGRKGTIAAGFDADLVIWNPEAQFHVEGANLHHRHKLTPYAGRLLNGVVEATWLRGRKAGERRGGRCISRN